MNQAFEKWARQQTIDDAEKTAAFKVFAAGWCASLEESRRLLEEAQAFLTTDLA